MDVPDLQKRIVYNDLLPYAPLLESLAKRQFEEIKWNLSVAIQKYELWPGALYWTNRLNSFLKVYGFHFSKDDHVHLIHLLYQLVTVHNLESPLLFTWCSVLAKLLKKWKVLSRDDLSLSWRPLYELSQRVFQSKFTALGMKLYPEHTCNAVRSLIQQARNYFPIESTKEMLQEWRPLLCPFDLSIGEGCVFLSEFLPTLLPPHLHEHGFKLWFEELVNLWLRLPSTSTTEQSFIKLFVRLSKHMIGYIDWSPYLQKILSRILRSFQLPVGRKEFQAASSKDFFEPAKSAQLIVGMMDGSNPAVQDHLSELMLALESYYHPSNVGKHSRSLLLFLKELASAFIRRLKSERFSKSTWYSQIPDAVKLSEDSIDAFVKSLLPAARLSVFSKFGTMEASATLHKLALVRPEMVLPDLLNSTYKALETLTEPHQVTASLQCVSAVSRALMSGGHGRFPEGKRHLFSLLMLALPGIDANDFRKTILSGLLISSLVSLVPLVDCSPSVNSEKLQMTEEEAEVCSMTSQFEDFVLQLLDRCFSLVDDSHLVQVSAMDRMVQSKGFLNHESIMGLGITGSIHVVLAQCSPQLFKVALDKLYRYATSHVFESEVAGRTCADMCSAAVKIDPVSSLKLFVPQCLGSIETILEDPEQLEAEHPDHNLLWNIQLLSQILQSVGSAVLPFADRLIPCLKKCVYLKSKTASQHAAKAVANCVYGLTMTYVEESRSTRVGFSLPPEEHLYIRDWSSPGDIKNLGIKWHVPSKEELELTDRFLVTFLQPEIDRLKRFIGGETIDRDSLHQSLNLVLEIVNGVSSYLPECEGDQVEGCPGSVVEFKQHYYNAPGQSKRPPKEFRRETLFSFLHQLSDYFLQSCENDTKGMFKLIKILHILLTKFGASKIDYETKKHAFAISRSALDDKLRGKKYDLRTMIITRVQLQHELRLVERSMMVLTQSHLTAIKDLVCFSVSSYAEVRIHAQRSLSESLEMYIYSARKIVPSVLPFLKHDEQVVHDQFKGALHVMLLPQVINVVVHDWEMLKNALPVIVKADHSEKPSILNLMSRLSKTIIQRYEYFALVCQVPDNCRKVAAELTKSVVSVEDSKFAKDTLISRNLEFMSDYTELVTVLVHLQENVKLQWRFSEIGIRFLALMIRHDHPFPTCGVKLIVKYLIHDSLSVRKLAVWAFAPLLQQQKRKIVKAPVDVAKEVKAYSGATCEVSGSEKVGEREDIKWLCYDAEHVPKTKQQWESFSFIDKTHWGYYTWPKTLLTHAPYELQSPLAREAKDLSEAELIVYESFTSQEFVDKLIGFFSIEEVKGKDRYDVRKYTMFKYLFRNFGISFLSLFRQHLEKLAVDSQESSQRCACEIIAGIVSGSKNWPFGMVKEMQSMMEPLLKQVIEVVTMETVEDWGNCMTDISANRDPRRLHWLLELLAEDPLHGKNGSFKDASRLYLLQTAIAQQEWRVPGLLHRIAEYLKSHLSHSFKNVREGVGGILSQVYVYDILLAQTVFNPCKQDFMVHLRPILPSIEQVTTLTKDEEMLRLCKTVLMYILRSYHHSSPLHFQLMAELLPLITVEDDEELGPLLLKVCALMSHAFILKETVPVAMDALKKGIDSGLWKVRILTLQVLQVLVFENLFLFSPASIEVTDLLLTLLEDAQTEVRELAASCISGFVRCGFISSFDQLKILFIKHSHCKLPKRQRVKDVGADQDGGYEACLVKRHSGVLGLAALVEACPYSVPMWLPDVVDELALHLHDPAPIQGTVKKAMSEFRRTHYDNWNEHKLKFTDDQLAVLTDLLISPSYYA